MKFFLSGLLLTLVVGCNPKVQVAKYASPAVVHIEAPMKIKFFNSDDALTIKVQGSGVFISKEGHILTCAHVVTKSTSVIVSIMNGTTAYQGTVLSSDPTRDLALVKISSFTTDHWLPLATRKNIKVGQDVLLIGHPIGLRWTVTAGIISAFDRTSEDLNALLVQTDADANPGNSGGPIVNMNGELVGILSFIRSPIPASIGLNFAISADTIREYLNQFKGL